jgi:hypothetical protein
VAEAQEQFGDPEEMEDLSLEADTRDMVKIMRRLIACCSQYRLYKSRTVVVNCSYEL